MMGYLRRKFTYSSFSRRGRGGTGNTGGSATCISASEEERLRRQAYGDDYDKPKDK